MALTLNYSALGMYGHTRKPKSGTIITRTYRGSGRVETTIISSSAPKKVSKPKRNRWVVEDESGLRRMEAYGAYRAAGSTDGFWEDDMAQGGRW